MSVIVNAGEVVVVVVVVSVEAGTPSSLPVVDFGFLFCRSLVEADLVLVEAAMDEEVRDEEDTRDVDRYAGILCVRVCDVEEYEGEI